VKTTTKIQFTANHPLHLAATIFTCGLWSPVWIVCAIIGRKTVITTDPFHPGYTPQPPQVQQPWQSCRGCGSYPGHHLRGCQYWIPAQRRG
jgi:hypothetical protein